MKRPWMPLYVGDYLADTRHLSTLQHGAYILLLMHYWQTGSLPTNDAQLARIAGLTLEEWTNDRSTIAAFFGEGWRHKRVDDELAKAEKLSNAGRLAGIASGEARKRTADERSFNGSPTKSQPPPSQPSSQVKIDSSLGEAKCEVRPPKHCATTTKAGGRVYVVKGTPEWDSYAADFREARGREPNVNSHGGRWFKRMGEASGA